MLLFIGAYSSVYWDVLEFQYISCYSLSLPGIMNLAAASGFQYISCYSLSHLQRIKRSRHTSFNTSHVTLYQYGWVRVKDKDMFQYISCYSLSKNAKADTDTKLRFNTSHVTLYRNLHGIRR